MTSIRPRSRSGRRFGLRLATGSAWLLLAVSPISVLAQGFGPDPFRPFNSQYDSYVYPIAPGALDAVGNPSLNRGIRGANQFENYLNSVNSGNVGTRFDQLYRSQISEHRRAFRPTHDADVRFEDQQASITTLYFDYLREKDPVKRAAAQKKYNQARSQATRDLSSVSRSASSRKAQKPKRQAAAVEGDKSQTTADEPIEGEEADKSDRLISPPRRSGRTDEGASTRRRAEAPAPPPIPGVSGTGSRARKPSEVLDRAVQSEGSGSRTSSRSGRSRSNPPPPPITP